MNTNLVYQEPLRTEFLDGKPVLMSPRPSVNHNIILGNLYRALANFLYGKPCIPFSDGTDVYLTPRDRVIPDVMIVCNRDIIQRDGVHGAPDFIVEVLSPSTRKRDRREKMKLYERCGVKEYWIVDPDGQSVEVYLLQDGSYTLDEVYSIYPDYVALTEEEQAALKHEVPLSLDQDCSIPLTDIFRNLF